MATPQLILGHAVGHGQSADAYAVRNVGIRNERNEEMDAVCKRYRALYDFAVHGRDTRTADDAQTTSIENLREQFEMERYMYAKVRELYYSAITPNVVLSANWDSTHDLVLEKCHSTLFHTFHPRRFRKVMGRRIQCMDWYVAIFQVVHVLAVLQEEFAMVHHDLHAGNVFLNLIDETFAWHDFSARDNNAIAYTLGEQRYYVPLRGFMIKVGDFNLACTFAPKGDERVYSSIADGCYQDYGMDGTFHAGYDMQVFLLNLLGFRKELELPKEVVRFIVDLLEYLVPEHKHWYRRVLEKHKTTKFYRPDPRHVSDIGPADMIAQGVFDQLFYRAGHTEPAV